MTKKSQLRTISAVVIQRRWRRRLAHKKGLPSFALAVHFYEALDQFKYYEIQYNLKTELELDNEIAKLSELKLEKLKVDRKMLSAAKQSCHQVAIQTTFIKK